MKPLEKAQFISNWIKDYVENMPSKAQSLVIGISGGIDSSVSSTLSACLLYTSPSPRDAHESRMPSSA